MNRLFFQILVALLLFSPSVVAQTVKTPTKKVENVDIFDELKRQNTPGSGKVFINQSAKLQILLDKKIAEAEEKSFITYVGYRIQVYMGNNQKKSKSEALKREKMIKEKYEDLPAYLSFVSPFWRLRMGDFRTHTDALVGMRKLLTDFPELKGEIYVVRDDETRDLFLEEE